MKQILRDEMIFFVCRPKKIEKTICLKWDIKGGCISGKEKKFHGNRMVRCIFADC